MLKRSIINTGWQIGSKAATTGLALVTTGILTRNLGMEGYGGFTLISSLFVLLDSLADFGVKTIGIRELAEGKKSMGKIIQLKVLLTSSSWIIGLLAILGMSSFVTIRIEALLALTMVWLTSMLGIGEIVWQKNLKMERKTVVDIIFPSLFLIGLWILKDQLSLITVYGILLGARVISLMWGWRWLKNEKEFLEIEWNEGNISNLWKEVWPMGVFLLLFAAYDRVVDSLMISHFLGVKEVAIYGLAYKIYGVLIQPAYFFVNSVFPLLSDKNANKKEIFNKSLGILILGMVVVVVVTLFLAPFMVSVLAGNGYEMSATVLRVLILGCVFTYIGHLVGFTLIARGGQKDLLKVGIIGLIFNVVANWILIPRFGIMAAAGVTVATEAVDLGLMIGFLYKKSKH